jgi:hypothetical protein
MSTAFLVFAVVFNVGFAAAVLWWVWREFRRSGRRDPRRKDSP